MDLFFVKIEKEEDTIEHKVKEELMDSSIYIKSLKEEDFTQFVKSEFVDKDELKNVLNNQAFHESEANKVEIKPVENFKEEEKIGSIETNAYGEFSNFNDEFNQNCPLNEATEKTPLECCYCNKTFSRKDYLKAHMLTHTGKKPFDCSHCGKKFTQKGSLNVHFRRHTGLKPFACDHCDKKFTRKSRLNSHYRTHTGVKPYKCGHCDKTFKRKDTMEVHMKQHTGRNLFDCDVCDKSFTQKSNLIVHVQTHAVIKPFSCGHCDKTFSQKTNLNRHNKKHTGQDL